MEISMQCSNIWDRVLELTKFAQENGTDPFLWAIHLSSQLSSAAVSLPSFELANLLVSYICWENNVPIAWKLLEKAFVFKILPSLPTLALISARVIPNRNSQPAAFRLYMELLKGHGFTFRYPVNMPNFKEIRNSLNAILNLSRIFNLEADEPGVLVVEIVFSIVWQLLDASLDDEGLLHLTPEKKSVWPTKPQEMDIGCKENLRKANTIMAIELIGCFLQNKVTSRILYLARQNMPVHWRGFIQRIVLLKENSMALRNSKTLTPEALLHLVSDNNSRLNLPRELPSATPSRFLPYRSDHYLGLSRSALWLPLDLVLEDAMDSSQVNAESAVEIITGLVKTLQAVHGSTWHDTFLGLWKAALYLVQRERDPIDGPVPRLDTRLSLLLSITTLVVADLIEEEEGTTDKNEDGVDSCCKKLVPENRRMDLVSCLQSLGDYETLLNPPNSFISAANQAAAKARMFVSGVNCGSSYVEHINLIDLPIDFSGNLRHLIVEACIARSLLDTSAYFWPGYVNGSINQMSHAFASEGPGWLSFMKGAALTPVLTNALVSAPASSFAEIEKIFEIAIKGSDDEKMAAASILCGATLIRGWNVQEHTVYFIARLLSPPAPADSSGNGNHLISYAPVLNVLIVGIAPVDCFQIFFLHGLVPQLACSLMTICEVFGSCIPDISWTLTTGEEISAHAVFSNAFALLLKLWRFNHPPLEYRVGDVPPVGCQLTPDFLLLVRNSLLVTSGALLKDPNRRRLAAVASASNPKPIFVDSFPKLKVWYRQHQACIASTLSGLVNGTPVHQSVDTLLNMMFRKVNRGNQSVISVASGSSSSSAGTDDSFPKPILPAWDILEAVPFVVDAALTACDHGRLSPRELCTGLKDLADYLPASLATIVSYFSAEVTRGVWKPVFMNGTDWPSPAANLCHVEEQMKKILAATGVDIPSLAAGESSPSSLPLPLAAFVSLTITYKLDKASQRFLNLAGPALESLAAGCPWPCMAIVASLWTQKAKRWTDFLVFSASRTVFLHNNDAVVKLLKSCFMATLGLTSTSLTSNGGVGSLLGHGFGSHFDGGISPVAPGILYLRAYRDIRDIMFLREEIVKLLMECIRDSACCDLPRGTLDKLKHLKSGKYGHASLAKTMTRVKVAASLAASLVWLTGGMGMVQSLIIETMPPLFLSVHQCEHQRDSSSMGIPMLRGYALAFFVVLCGSYAWGVDSSSTASKRRPAVLGYHMEFVANALHGKISLGCNTVTWHAYVVVLLSLMIDCMPTWIRELDVKLLRKLSEGLLQWREEDLALALLGVGGVGTMGMAAEMIMDDNP